MINRPVVATTLVIASLMPMHAAQAEVRAMVAATDPAGESITLGRDEPLWVRVAYTADEPARLWVRPYFRGREVATPGTRSNPSASYSGAGYALGWFSFAGAAQADEIRILAGTPGGTLEVARYPVSIAASGTAPALRTQAAWVEPLRRETEAHARLERERWIESPGTSTDRALTYALMLVIAAVVIGIPALVAWTAWKAARGELTVARGDRLPYAASAVGGLAVCFAVSLISGRKEAWDSSLYFSLGIPAMCVIIFAIAWFHPVRAWRWTLAMALGQWLALLAAGNSLSLWPLSIIAMAVCSLPQFVTGIAASRIRAWAL